MISILLKILSFFYDPGYDLSWQMVQSALIKMSKLQHLPTTDLAMGLVNHPNLTWSSFSMSTQLEERIR